jgi:hypothetical protein
MRNVTFNEEKIIQKVASSSRCGRRALNPEFDNMSCETSLICYFLYFTYLVTIILMELGWYWRSNVISLKIKFQIVSQMLLQ